jgi:hypothetical protein
MKKRCPACCRPRPKEEFEIGSGEIVMTAPICLSCRKILWENPDDPAEGV